MLALVPMRKQWAALAVTQLSSSLWYTRPSAAQLTISGSTPSSTSTVLERASSVLSRWSLFVATGVSVLSSLSVAPYTRQERHVGVGRHQGSAAEDAHEHGARRTAQNQRASNTNTGHTCMIGTLHAGGQGCGSMAIGVGRLGAHTGARCCGGMGARP